MSKKYTLVLGASEKSERYSNKAVKMLTKYNHPVLAIGNKKGMIDQTEILIEPMNVNDIDTVTLYLNAGRQLAYYDYILSLKPKRIIFNPGTENDELEQLAAENNIETLEACTLVLLSTGQY
jgi:predicted CoA-binding protein